VERTAYQAALDLLARRDHFRRELGTKLARRSFPSDNIEEALDRCEELGLLDDEKTAKRFVEVRAAARGWGPRRLEAELLERGVARDLAEIAAKLPPEAAEEAMRTALRRLVARAPAGWWRDGQRRARMVSSLIGRGFAADDAYAAIRELAAERENDHAPDEQPPDSIGIS
jgi:regulatory protein